MHLQPFCAKLEGADFLYNFLKKNWNNSRVRQNPAVNFFQILYLDPLMHTSYFGQTVTYNLFALEKLRTSTARFVSTPLYIKMIPLKSHRVTIIGRIIPMENHVFCFGVRVSVMFHLMSFHYTFSSILAAEWPPFGKKLPTRLAICSQLSFVFLYCFSYFQFWF